MLLCRWGRIRTQSAGYALCAISAVLLGTRMSSPVLSTVGIVARCAVMSASCATWVATPELFPTELRATGHAVASSVARIGAFSAPFLVDSNASPLSVGIVIAVFSGGAAAAVLFLPETAGRREHCSPFPL